MHTTTLTIAAVALLGSSLTAAAANFVQSPRAAASTGTAIERGAASQSDGMTVGSIRATPSTSTGDNTRHESFGVVSPRIASQNPYRYQ